MNEFANSSCLAEIIGRDQKAKKGDILFKYQDEINGRVLKKSKKIKKF